jgi:hypothetical protein
MAESGFWVWDWYWWGECEETPRPIGMLYVLPRVLLRTRPVVVEKDA